jgi:pyruvate,water dikinase
MNESEFDKLQPGDVLVCPITSPVWSVLFPSVGALVTEAGGILSHPAIIAREYRVPAVVATGNATSLLSDGQVVRVDGTSGLVEPVSTVTEDEQINVPIPISAEPPPGYWIRNADHQPHPTSPMNNSVFREHQRTGVKRMFDDYGLLIERVDVQDIGGWEYLRMVPVGGSDGPELPKWLMRLLVRIVPMIRRRIKISEEAIRTDKPGRLVQRWYDEFRPQLAGRIDELRDVDLDQLSDRELEDHLEAINALFGKTFGEVGPVRHLSCAFILYDLVKTCRELLGWDERKAFELVTGTSYKSLEPSRRLNELTQLTKERSTVQELLEKIDDGTVERLREVDEEFASAFESYLDEYGHRALRYEVADPTLAESPELVLKLIRSQIVTGYDPEATEELLSQRRTETAAQARNLLNERPVDLARFERVLERAEMAYPVREDNEFYCVSVPVALLRYAVLELGERLTERGVLEQRDDVFFLGLDEAQSALLEGQDLNEVIQRRQGERAWAQANPGPPSFGQEPGSPPSLDFLPAEARLAMEVVMWYFDPEGEADAPMQTNQSGPTLTGTAASAGQFTGPARVIMHEGEFDKLQPGDVLVCPTTSPVWSVLFPSIGALVTNTGGMLSHPAIIAREYQVPAVVALGDATSILKDGQIVTVDGTAGTVKQV